MVYLCKNHHRFSETENGKCPFCKEEAYKAKMGKECLLEKNIADIGSDGICNKCKEEENESV